MGGLRSPSQVADAEADVAVPTCRRHCSEVPAAILKALTLESLTDECHDGGTLRDSFFSSGNRMSEENASGHRLGSPKANRDLLQGVLGEGLLVPTSHHWGPNGVLQRGF